MTTTKTYTCDVCGDTARTGNGVKLIGLYWSGAGGWIEKPLHDCEHHICEACIMSIVNVWNEHDETK